MTATCLGAVDALVEVARRCAGSGAPWPDRAWGRLPGVAAAPVGDHRPSAVLILFGCCDSGEKGDSGETGDSGEKGDTGDTGQTEVLLTERAATMRSHAGQIAFPGGAIDDGDSGPVQAALREAHEEAGLDVDGVRVLGVLPQVYLSVSGFLVTPVLAWWDRPSPVRAVDSREVSRVLRVRVPELVDPANRFAVRYPSGQPGPAFQAADVVIWGFTAALLDQILWLAEWEQEWDRTRLIDMRELQR